MSRTLGRASILGALALPLLACSSTGAEERSDADKRARIDALYSDYKDEFPDVPETNPEALQAALKAAAPPVVVDVRTEEEQRISMIPGAISQHEFEVDPARFEGREVVTYCTIGYRSGVYAQKLREKGWKASNLRGSILAWTHAGLDLVRTGAPTRRVHVYGATWDLAAEGYEAVW